MPDKFLHWLRQHSACNAGYIWVEAHHLDAHQTWEQLDRADWLLWYALQAGVETKLLIAAGCDCAESVLHLVLAGEDRPAQAIAITRQYLAGEVTIEAVREARKAAAAAGAAAAADAAADAAAAAYAAYAAAYAADAAARKSERQWQADKIRSLIPNPFEK